VGLAELSNVATTIQHSGLEVIYSRLQDSGQGSRVVATHHESLLLEMLSASGPKPLSPVRPKLKMNSQAQVHVCAAQVVRVMLYVACRKGPGHQD
jgi:hypothetical protein